MKRTLHQRQLHLQEEKRVQAECTNMMADHQYQEEREQYKRPPQTNTMYHLAAATRKQRGGAQRPTSATPVQTPKRAEVKPWVDISRPPGLGPMGVFAGEGGSQTCA